MSKVAIPQADEQQRLLANLITQMNLDRTPLPRFWYLPRGEKAAVVMTGDDHGNGGTAASSTATSTTSPAGCSVADWQCVRTTSYVYPEHADHRRPGADLPGRRLRDRPAPRAPAARTSRPPRSGRLADAAARSSHDAWPSLAAPAPTARTASPGATGRASRRSSSRTASASTPTTTTGRSWVQDRPGMFTGSGFPMRFADADGSLIDVYQATTQMTDESEIDIADAHPGAARRRPGPHGYYGVFTANMHTDHADHPAPTRSSPRPRRAASGGLGRADARLARRPQRLVVRGPRYSGGSCASRSRRRRRARPAGDGPGTRPAGDLSAPHARRHACDDDAAHGQGRRLPASSTPLAGHRYLATNGVAGRLAARDGDRRRPVAGDTASFTFSANEPGARFECRLDGAAFTPCASPAGSPGSPTARTRSLYARSTRPATPTRARPQGASRSQRRPCRRPDADPGDGRRRWHPNRRRRPARRCARRASAPTAPDAAAASLLRREQPAA